MSAKFTAIAQRKLVHHHPNGSKMDVFLAIGAPYKRAKMEAMSNYAACEVLTCDDPDLASEMYGEDEVEALASGLAFLELYLIKLIEETGGILKNKNGEVFDPRGSRFFIQTKNHVYESKGKPD